MLRVGWLSILAAGQARVWAKLIGTGCAMDSRELVDGWKNARFDSHGRYCGGLPD
jgi:hypothetical protein